MNQAVFVKIGRVFEKVLYSEILYIQASGSYSTLQTERGEFTIARNLHTVFEQLNRPEFLRVHRTYVVNLYNIDRIEERGVTIQETFIPVSKKLREKCCKNLILYSSCILKGSQPHNRTFLSFLSLFLG